MSINPVVANKILDHMAGKTEWTMPTNIWVSIHVGNPGETGGNEHGATSEYARIETAPEDWNAASNSHLDNAGTLSYATATAPYSAPITHFGLWIHATSADPNYFIGGRPLAESKVVGTHDTLKFAAGDIDWAIT